MQNCDICLAYCPSVCLYDSTVRMYVSICPTYFLLPVFLCISASLSSKCVNRLILSNYFNQSHSFHLHVYITTLLRSIQSNVHIIACWSIQQSIDPSIRPSVRPFQFHPYGLRPYSVRPSICPSTHLRHSFIPSFLHFFLPFFLPSFLPSFIHSFIYTFIHSFTMLSSRGVDQNGHHQKREEVPYSPPE